jgi:processive 1,2-diacylglycerol beta-glucosyltransferase
MGHDMMATACAASFETRAWTTETLDAMALLGGMEHRAGETVFRSLLSIPGSYDALHFAGLRSGSVVARFLDNQATKRIAPRVQAHLTGRPARVVISVFATAASAMGRVRSSFPDVKTVTFCTDLNPHRMWVHPTTDVYLLTSHTSEAFVRRFHPEAEVVIVPAPVREQFYAAPTRPEARSALGVPDDAPCALLMAGAWGLGPLVEVATSLARAGVHTIAVAGRNTTTEARLRDAERADGRVHAFGFTNRVPELMAACDVVVTTSGDTCSEARVIGRSLVLLDVVAGHGRENLQHELELGGAVVASTDPGLLVRAVLRALEHNVDPPADLDRRKTWEQGLDEVLAVLDLAD